MSRAEVGSGVYKGFNYKILRMPIGHLCGYVMVREEHKAFQLDYDGVEELYSDLDVHGGLTFSGRLYDDEESYWIGFDCGHYMDVGHPKGAEFCVEECKKIIDAIG